MTRVGLMLIPIAGAAVAGALLLGGHQADQAGPRWRAILEPVAGQSTRGGAMVEARGDESTRFTITIRNAPENATLAWHLHSGTCAAPGDVVGAGYPELRVGPGGTAQAAVTLAISPPRAGNHIVQVHGANNAVISCGELRPLG